jgi:hypothetical protein
MKWTLQLVLLIAVVCNAKGQEHFKGTTACSNSPVNIALDEVNKVFVAPPLQLNILKSAKSSQSNFKVTYVNFPEEAKQAFQYAVSIWEELISSPVPIHIEAQWEQLEGNILAKGNPSIFYNNFSGAPLRNVYYPVALAEKISGKEMNAGAPDIICRFNKKFQWYFGTDGNTPSTHYDFVSSALHEITHGLGFSGFFNENDGKGYFNNSHELPSIYDYLLFNNQNQQISDKSLFQSNTKELYKQITSDNVKFCQANTSGQEQKIIDWIFAPPVWNDGTSIYHLKGYAYGEENGLMTPFAVKGRAIHNPGEVTMAILAELGWKTVTFEFEPLKDIEKILSEIPVKLSIKSDDNENQLTSVRIIYSTDGFSSVKYIDLQQDETSHGYAGKMLAGSQPVKIQYYIEARTSDNRTFRHPSDAPSNLFTMNIGPDYYVPNLFHNPVKMLAGNLPEIEIKAEAIDNIGIGSVKVDYKINGILQESFSLENRENDLFAGKMTFPQLRKNDHLEYRITAEDNSFQKNKRSFPAIGFQDVEIFFPQEPVLSYSTGSNMDSNDFSLADFDISPISGFSGSILHTKFPYPVSASENENYNLIAQLNYPVIIAQDGLFSFDEVVLVEPGSPGSMPDEPDFWDFVVVEASLDGGITWLQLSEKYDSRSNDTWNAAFSKSFSGNTSTAMPHESMFVNHAINLTHNTGLEAGDTAVFRFRMASDSSVNGFGWAISNLEIQGIPNEDENLFAEGGFQIYPNPVKNHLFIEWSEQLKNNPVEVVVSDMTGKVICRETGIEPIFSPKTRIDLSGMVPGMYLVSIREGMEVFSTSKIVKN